MKLLHDAILQDSYEVVVVGSGLAGLTAASLLAKRGMKVLLVEHHYLPGGMCTTVRRQGFSFDTGTALLYGFGERGVNPHRFVMNQLEEKIEIISHDMLLRINFGDKKINLWPDYERFLEEITAAFPQQQKQLRDLYAYLHKVYTKVIARQPMIVPPTEMPAKENLRALLQHPVLTLQTLRMLSTSTESVLRKYVNDPDLLAFFDKLTSTYCYCTVRETPAILAATMFVDNHIGGAYYPARSPQILASTLEKAVERHGGEVLYGRRVEEIMIEGERATGVRLSDGTIIHAERVVANATVWNLYGKLIKAGHIRPDRLAWAQKQVPTYPAMVLYLGVKAEVIPPGTNPVEMFIADKTGVNSGDVTVYISSLDDPSIAPAGTHAMTVIAPSTISWPASDDGSYRTSEEYLEQKAKERDRILDQLERHFPKLRENVLVMETGTPCTIERYTLKNGGAVGGPKQSIGQEMMKRLHGRSEWKNLYFCGDSTVMGMGAPAVTVSGVGAANLVLRDAGLREYSREVPARDYVSIVKGRPLRPVPGANEPLDIESVMRLARECQYCERPGCTASCPAHIDVRSVMRKIEAGNMVGAARTLHEMNPLSEVCGYACKPLPPCERACNRLGFSPDPVRIADLQSWVCREAGEDGWSTQRVESRRTKAAVIGAGPAGLAAAHWLGRLGHAVELFDRRQSPGGTLHEASTTKIPPEVISREIRNLLRHGISFVGGQQLGKDLDIQDMSRRFDVLLVATGGKNHYHADGRVFEAGSLVVGPCAAVMAVGDARRAVEEIHKYLGDNAAAAETPGRWATAGLRRKGALRSLITTTAKGVRRISTPFSSPPLHEVS